ncbi:putative cytochrome P450 6a14 [Calliopsis andreniformis]|uniref:putative cytochrome P450 6a14 n=1 Tax=Calliopsis andreniformis TaxID=337506 RepID=UPI003FCDB190
MASYFEIFLIVGALCYALYYYWTLYFNFWKKRGVPGPKPIPAFGNALELMLGKQSVPEFTTRLYRQYRGEPMVGIFLRRMPCLIVQDPELIKDVLIKDFSKFMDRGFKLNEVIEPLNQHLFAIDSKRWRPLRSQLTPLFTSGKLKGTFALILECAEHLEKFLDKLVMKGDPIECRELAAQFTTDVIGSCAFGIEMNSLSESESEFRRIGREIFATHFTAVLKLRMRESCSWLYNKLGYIIPPYEVTTFIMKLVKDTMEYRKKNNLVRQDFMNTLLELEKHPEKLGGVELTPELIAAQAFVFFAAGFETSSTTISNTLYELALNPEIQDKLREEITNYETNSDGQWRYETIKEMKYLDKVFKETLRKYPALAILNRETTGSHTFRNTKVSIPPKTLVWIPVYAIHWDPQIYPMPEKFDPERFDESVAKTRHPMYHLPFGDGPRNCIGARFAVYQTKIGLIKIIGKYKVERCDLTPTPPYAFNPFSFVLAPKDGLYLKITKIGS